MRRPGKGVGILGLIAVVIALLGLIVVQVYPEYKIKPAGKCNDCTGVTEVRLGF